MLAIILRAPGGPPGGGNESSSAWSQLDERTRQHSKHRELGGQLICMNRSVNQQLFSEHQLCASHRSGSLREKVGTKSLPPLIKVVFCWSERFLKINRKLDAQCCGKNKAGTWSTGLRGGGVGSGR